MSVADKLVFRGIDTKECEEFIEAVRRLAFAQGKQRDNEWIIDLVQQSLAGDALRWHVTLPQETQNDWYLLQQALVTQFPVVFRGIDGVECDSFVRHVRRKAVEEGKLKDPIWMADYAAEAFAGDALRWYDALDEETKGNWNLLQTELFLKYPASDVRRPLSDYTEKGTSSIVASLAPTPAAAPVSAVQGPFSTGGTAFIKVTASSEPELSGHISRHLQSAGRHTTTKAGVDFLRVSAVASGNHYQLKLMNPTVPHEYLGLTWSVDKPDLRSRDRAKIQYAGLVAVSDPYNSSKDSSETALKGPIACLLWEVSPDGSLAPVWEGFTLRVGINKNKKGMWVAEPQCTYFTAASETPVELRLIPE